MDSCQKLVDSWLKEDKEISFDYFSFFNLIMIQKYCLVRERYTWKERKDLKGLFREGGNGKKG